MNKDLEERQLWELLCEGDQDALQKLYITYYNPLLQYGLKYSDDHDTPKDSINSTFLYIWEKRTGLSSPNNVGSYIFKCYQRQLLKDLNKNNRTSKLTLPEELKANADIQDFQFIIEQEESKRILILKNAILDLPKRQRELIKLRYYHGLSYDEIAEKTQLSKRSIYNQIHTAIKSLKLNPNILTIRRVSALLFLF